METYSVDKCGQPKSLKQIKGKSRNLKDAYKALKITTNELVQHYNVAHITTNSMKLLEQEIS